MIIFLYRFPCELAQNRPAELGQRQFLLEMLVLRICSFFPQAFIYYHQHLSNIRKDKEVIPALRDSGESRRKTAEAEGAGFGRKPGLEAFSLASR